MKASFQISPLCKIIFSHLKTLCFPQWSEPSYVPKMANMVARGELKQENVVLDMVDNEIDVLEEPVVSQPCNTRPHPWRNEVGN